MPSTLLYLAGHLEGAACLCLPPRGWGRAGGWGGSGPWGEGGDGEQGGGRLPKEAPLLPAPLSLRGCSHGSGGRSNVGPAQIGGRILHPQVRPIRVGAALCLPWGRGRRCCQPGHRVCCELLPRSCPRLFLKARATPPPAAARPGLSSLALHRGCPQLKLSFLLAPGVRFPLGMAATWFSPQQNPPVAAK